MAYQRSLLDQLDDHGTSDWRPSPPPSLKGVKRIALDVETTGLKWWSGDRIVGVALRTPDGRSCYMPTRHPGSYNLDESRVKEWLKSEVRDLEIVNLNDKFDAHNIRETFGVDLEEQGCRLVDVGHQAALLDDHRTHFNLDALGNAYLGRGKYKGIDAKKIGSLPAHVVAPYAMEDVNLAWELDAVMAPMIQEQGLEEVKRLEEDVTFAVLEMERNAARIDEPLLRQWVVDSEQEFLRTMWQIHRETGMKVEPNKSRDIEALYHKLGLPISSWTLNGQASFTDDILANCSHPSVALVRRARKLQNLRSKYLVSYADVLSPGSLLRYHLHQLRVDEGGTVSGRFSASDKNIQQVMTEKKQAKAFGDMFIIRQLFIPHLPDWLFLSADAEQIEFRLFAHFAQSIKLIEAYRENPRINFHETVWAMVKQFAEIGYKEVKNLNFAKIYGAGIFKLALMLNVSESEAKLFSRQYDQAFPDVRRMLAYASDVAKSRGYVKTLSGRRSRFPTRERLHKALNGVIQGSAADVMKKKLVELHRARRLTGMILRFTVHDEVCGDVPDQAAAAKVAQILDNQSYNLRVPILWKVKTGRNWREAA